MSAAARRSMKVGRLPVAMNSPKVRPLASTAAYLNANISVLPV
jgi:hypothetical protein